ncbi:MAG: hypothetical protein DCF22_01835 [Leptolyngbya sp.]|nr:MAG: hypothetical protein DCF22_01835 [Leptolyngbya sp.]
MNSTKSIFFYCVPQGLPEDTAYQHNIVCLGEGLKALDIPFYSNVDYWRLSADKDEYLFKCDSHVTPEDCDVVVLNQSWVFRNNLPRSLFNSKRKYITAHFDSSDGTRTSAWDPAFRQFDFIFRTHYCSSHRYPTNFYPWFFGLSDRILKETEEILKFEERRKSMLINFRLNNIPHSVRVAAVKDFLPKIQTMLPTENPVDGFNQPPSDPNSYLQWLQTARRHYPSYYRNLKQVAACACFGGFFVSDFLVDPSTNLARLSKRIIGKSGIKTRSIVQWDSWRLWEALASGTVAFHVDFDKYGFTLPTMPENWKHYVGIDLNNVQESIERLSDDPECLERISVEGRQWVRENYNPVATATRFIEAVSG